MLSSCSPFAILQSTSTSQKRFLHVSGAQSLQLLPTECFLTAWLWRAEDLVFLIPWVYNNDSHPGRNSHLNLVSDFCGCFQETPLHCLALVVSEVYDCVLHGTIINRERILEQLQPSLLRHSKE